MAFVAHWFLMFSSQVKKSPNQLTISGLVHCGPCFYLETHFCLWSLNPACEQHKCALKYFRLNLKMRSKFFGIPGRAVEVAVRQCARCRRSKGQQQRVTLTDIDSAHPPSTQLKFVVNFSSKLIPGKFTYSLVVLNISIFPMGMC